jgi:phospholipid/cholesterol/gamma-HCH transport system substrate-binding protein
MKLFGKNRAQTSFLERNQMIIGVLAATFVLGGSAFALLLSGGVFADTYSVTAYFSDAAGLKSGDDVKVAGLDAGKVGAVEIEDGKVAVQLKVNSDVEMPADSTAEIAIETLLGKKNVTLFSGSSSSLLADGDEIGIESTRTPVDLIQLADTSVDLLEASDADALQTFMEEVTKITSGKRTQITTLVNGLADVSAAIDSRSTELSRLIDSLRTVSGTFAERDETLVNMIDNYDVVLGNLAERTDDLQSLLENTDLAAHEVASMVRRNRPELDSALNGLHLTLTEVEKHQTDLAATISYLNDSVRGYQSVGYSQGVPNRWANIFVQSLGPAGMDAAFGPCGTFDQALDQLLGPDPRPCHKRADYNDHDDPEEPSPIPGKNDGPEEDDDEIDVDEGLPGDLGDLLDSITGSTGLGAALRGGLL